MNTSKENIDKFWRIVCPGDDNECWIWPYAKDRKGYGKWSTKNDGRWVTVKAHRFSLTIKLGREIRSGLQAAHTCDNPPCVNPNHLYEATQVQNELDKFLRGRNDRMARTHCPGGHALSGNNLKILPGKNTNRRNCHACSRASAWVSRYPDWDFDIVAAACYKHSTGAAKALRAEGLIVEKTKEIK